MTDDQFLLFVQAAKERLGEGEAVANITQDFAENAGLSVALARSAVRRGRYWREIERATFGRP